MHYGKRSSWQRPHDAAYSSRAPSVAREHPVPCRPLRPEPQDGGQVAQADHDGRCADGAEGPKSTVLTPAEEAIVVAFRQKTLLPLDDVLGCLKDTIPNLSRSALHRCLQRHGISRLPKEETSDKRKRFKTYEIGYVHIDSCELRHADGKLHMFLAIDRVSKFTYVEFHERIGSKIGADFLRAVAASLSLTRVASTFTRTRRTLAYRRRACGRSTVSDHPPRHCRPGAADAQGAGGKCGSAMRSMGMEGYCRHLFRR